MAAGTYRHPDQHVGGTAAEPVRVRTGIEGFDVILGSGLPRGYLYVVEGYPGTGKTTLALQFLLAGRENNEPCLLITTSETRNDLTTAARGHGWSLAGIEILELSLTPPINQPEQRQTMFRPSQIVFDEVMDTVQAEIARVQPMRMVFDYLPAACGVAEE
jgi:circadian clock protein KaiC